MQETQVWALGREDPLEKDMQPIPVFLPGKSHGERAWQAAVHSVTKELDMTGWLNNTTIYPIINSQPLEALGWSCVKGQTCLQGLFSARLSGQMFCPTPFPHTLTSQCSSRGNDWQGFVTLFFLAWNILLNFLAWKSSNQSARFRLGIYFTVGRVMPLKDVYILNPQKL